MQSCAETRSNMSFKGHHTEDNTVSPPAPPSGQTFRFYPDKTGTRLLRGHLSAVNVPAGQQLGDVGPAVPQLPVGLTDDAVLLQRPAALLHRRVQVVVPALTALLPITAVQVSGNERPALHTVRLNQINDLRRK